MTEESKQDNDNPATDSENILAKEESEKGGESPVIAMEDTEALTILCTTGVIAFIVVFVSTSAVIAVDHQIEEPTAIPEHQTTSYIQEEMDPPELTRNGWATLAAHFVPLETNEIVYNQVNNGSFDDRVEGSSETSFPLNDILTSIPVTLLYIIPLIVLPVAGYVTTKLLGTHTHSRTTAAVGAASVVIGYSPAVVVMSLYAKWEVQMATGWVVYQPSVLYAGIVGGMIIPMAYAAIGGVIAHSVQTKTEGRSSSHRGRS